MSDEKKKGNIEITHRAGRVNLEGWGFEEIDEITEMFATMMEKKMISMVETVLQWAMDEKEVYGTWPAIWTPEDEDSDDEGSDGLDGPTVESPLMLHLSIAMGDPDEPIIFLFDMEKSLLEEISACGEDGSFGAGLLRIAERFQALANLILQEVPAGRARRAAFLADMKNRDAD